MKTIWILNHYAMPPQLGPMVRHYKFGAQLVKRGYNVRVFTSSKIHNTSINVINDSRLLIEKEYGQVPFVFIRTRDYFGNGMDRIKGMIEYAFRLVRVVRKSNFEEPDVIYASSAHPLTWLSGYILAKRYNAKFVAETRDLWPETLVAMGRVKRNSIPAKLLYSLEKFIYKKADKLVFTFPGGKDYVASIGLDTSKVRYINNGVDLEEFNRNKDKYVYSDVDLDQSNVFKVVYTGSMGQANALRYLIEAAEIVQDRGVNDIRFLLFGDGYQRSELEEYVREKRLTHVMFKGKVEKKNIPGILSKSNLNVFNGQPIYLYKYGLSLNKMFEYFASGKPTISNIECGYDLLDLHQCGITVKGGSAEALADGILAFYNMPKSEYDAYCHNALRAAKEYDFRVLTNKLEEVLRGH